MTYDLDVTGSTETVGLLIGLNGTVTGSAPDERWLTQYVTASYKFGNLVDDSVTLFYGANVATPPISGTGNYRGSGDYLSGFTGEFEEDNVYVVQTIIFTR
jgi:hypothetical protein